MKRKKVKFIYSVESFGCNGCGNCHKNMSETSMAQARQGVESGNKTSTNCR